MTAYHIDMKHKNVLLNFYFQAIVARQQNETKKIPTEVRGDNDQVEEIIDANAVHVTRAKKRKINELKRPIEASKVNVSCSFHLIFNFFLF